MHHSLVNSEAEISAFFDRNTDHISLKTKLDQWQLVDIALQIINNPEFSDYLSKHRKNINLNIPLLESHIVNILMTIRNEQFPEKEFIWHLNRFKLLGDDTYHRIFYLLLAEYLSISNTTKFHQLLSPLIPKYKKDDFLLEKSPIGKKNLCSITEYLIEHYKALSKQEKYRSWEADNIIHLFPNDNTLSIKYRFNQIVIGNPFIDKKDTRFLVSAIIWDLNRREIYKNRPIKKINNTIHINMSEYKTIDDFFLEKIIKYKGLTYSNKVQILLESTNPEIEIYSTNPRSIKAIIIKQCFQDILLELTSWQIIDHILKTHPQLEQYMIVFFAQDPDNKHSDIQIFDITLFPKVIDNLLALLKREPNETIEFVKKYPRLFFNLEWEYKNKFINTLLKEENDLIDIITKLPYIGENFQKEKQFQRKLDYLFEIGTHNAYNEIWALFENIVLTSSDINISLSTDRLKKLVDQNQAFNFEKLHDIALTNEEVAWQFINLLSSEKLSQIVENNPSLVRDILIKYPDKIYNLCNLIDLSSPPKSYKLIFKTIFDQQDIFIDLIKKPHEYVLYSCFILLAINTPLSRNIARNKIRQNLKDIKLDELSLLFDGSFLLDILNQSLTRSEKKQLVLLNAKGIDSQWIDSQFEMIEYRAKYYSPKIAKFILDYFPTEIEINDLFKTKVTNQRDSILNELLEKIYKHGLMSIEQIYTQFNACLVSHYDSNSILSYDTNIDILNQIIIATEKEILTQNEIQRIKKLSSFILEPKKNEFNLDLINELKTNIAGLENRLEEQSISNINHIAILIKAIIKYHSKRSHSPDEKLFPDSIQKELHHRLKKHYDQYLFDNHGKEVISYILADATYIMLKKFQKALEEYQIDKTIINEIRRASEPYIIDPSRLTLEKRLQKQKIEQEIINKILDKCSDEILPKFLYESLNKLIRYPDKVSKDSLLISFLEQVYLDYPQGWSRAIYKLLLNYRTISDQEWIKKLIFSLGVLREPLGGKVPKLLSKIINDKYLDKDLQEIIKRQKKLFDRENFNRGHFRKAENRVAGSLNHLIKEN